MKKISKYALLGAMALSLVACGGGNDSGAGNTNNTPVKNQDIKLELEKNYEHDNETIELFKIETTKKIEAPVGGWISYSASDGDTYIDVVFDYTNLREEGVNSDDALDVKAILDDGTEYDCGTYLVETDNGSSISSYETISPLATVRLHAAISVPESTEKAKIKVVAGDKTYYHDYEVMKVVKTENLINVNDTIGDQDYAEVLFKGTEFADVVLPSNTSGYYSYYEVDNSSNTYLVVKMDITNYQANAKDCEDFVAVKAKFAGKYNYNGFIALEDTDGAGLHTYESIDPLTTRKAFYLIEVPKTIVDMECELTIYFKNLEYTYKMK